MKRTLFHILRIAVPIALGVWLVHYSYAQLDDRQREELFEAFRQADLRWLLAVLVLGWLSHVSRAWR